MLKTQITDDLKAAMLAGDENAKLTIRSLKAEIMKEEVAGTESRQLDDGEILKIIRRMIKQRREAADQFEKGNRPELAANEIAQIAIIEKYLPAQMGEAELTAIAEKKKAELGVADRSGAGKLIGAIMREVGDAADGAAVKAAVDRLFA